MVQFKVAQTANRDYFNATINTEKLTLQWIVDSYLKVDMNNLNSI